MAGLLFVWTAFLSVLAFAMMGADKRQARRGGRRIPEKNLWTAAWLGGGPGAYLGMIAFRHKTRHMNFKVGFLLLALLDAAVLVLIAVNS